MSHKPFLEALGVLGGRWGDLHVSHILTVYKQCMQGVATFLGGEDSQDLSHSQTATRTKAGASTYPPCTHSPTWA